MSESSDPATDRKESPLHDEIKHIPDGIPLSTKRSPQQILSAVLVGLIAFVFFVSPWPLFRKLDFVGYACCNQAPSRTLTFGGTFMPLDARDAGLYTSFLVCYTLAVVAGRGRATKLPPRWLAQSLIYLIVIMVIDGINSSIQVAGGHSFYDTTNTIRLWTGAAAGLALAVLLVPIANRFIWRIPMTDAIASSGSELIGYVMAAFVATALLVAPRTFLFYPMSIIATLGVLLAWGTLNSIIVLISTRHERRAELRSDGVLVLLCGLTLTLVEIGAVDLLRSASSH